jgi:hypothetical protein
MYIYMHHRDGEQAVYSSTVPRSQTPTETDKNISSTTDMSGKQRGNPLETELKTQYFWNYRT